METIRGESLCFQNRDVSDGIASYFYSQDQENFREDDKHILLIQNEKSTSLQKDLLGGLEKTLNRSTSLIDESRNYKELCSVKGEDINDIPTSYFLQGFQPNEFVVIGTYLDKHITPGFKYRVRQINTNKNFFDGKALYLESVGLGYGKRLTFASECLNNNKNYFWSDNSPNGFGFSLEAVSVGEVFSLFNSVTKSSVGQLIVNNSVIKQTETNSHIKNNGDIEKDVKVSFTGCLHLKIIDKVCSSEVTVSGIASLVKEKKSKFASLKVIKLDSYPVENCELHPANVNV